LLLVGRITLYLHGALICQNPAPENLGYTPCLGDASPGFEGGIAVENFADRADGRFVQMLAKAFEQAARSLAIRRINFEPGVYKRSNEPGPDGALMISGVAGS
jgi:hypothetical protein